MLNQYLNTIVTVTMPWFGSTATAEYITKIGLGGDVKDITPAKRKPYHVQGVKILQFTFDHYREAMARSFVSSLAKVFHPDFLKVDTKTVPAFADEWALYEHLLSSMDWYYQFSDDHRVWSAGESAMSRLRMLRLTLSKSYEGKVKADELWAKYAK